MPSMAYFEYITAVCIGIFKMPHEAASKRHKKLAWIERKNEKKKQEKGITK